LIVSQTVAPYELGPRELITVSIQWIASVAAVQRIYAKIDPFSQLAEVHDELDGSINNNKGYGLLSMGKVDFVDIGLSREQAYYATSYGMADTLKVTFSIPPGNLPETARFDLRDTLIGMRNVAGNPFELAAYIGSEDGDPTTGAWESPVPNYQLRSGALFPPAAISVSYGDQDIAGFNET
jgi:hypothetical protein